MSDETGFRNVTSYQSLPGTAGITMPWSPTFPEYFKRLKGYDLKPILPSLWYSLGPQNRMYRYDLMDAYTHCFAETFFKPQQEWCRAHGVQLIGHLVEDNHADHNLGYGPGHWFRAMQYLDIPGIDVVGFQVTPGLDAGGNRWSMNSRDEWDQEFFSFGLPAMARGAALMKGSPQLFSEAFGANGWCEGLRMVKWIGDWHIVNGFTFITPHAVTMKFNDPDCPPHFNRSSGNPQWRYYKSWADYSTRLQKIVAESEPRYDVAVLYTAESKWMGAAMTADPVIRALENHQISTVVLPYDTWETHGTFADGQWHFNGQQIPIVVLPYVRYVSAKTIARLAEFAGAGGRVVVLDRWPEASLDGRGDAEVQRAVSALKEFEHAAVIAFPDLTSRIASLASVQLTPHTSALMVSRCLDKTGEWLFLHNRSLSANVQGTLLIKYAAGFVARFDAESARYFSVPSSSVEGGLQVDVDIPPYGLWCLRLALQLPPVQPPSHFDLTEELPGPWQVSKATDDSGNSFELIGMKDRLIDWRRWDGLHEFAGTLRYRCSFTLPRSTSKQLIGINAGRVEEIAELKVNGVTAGVRLNPPYEWDITPLVKFGENVLEIDVTNTAQAKWKDDFSRGEPVSGLLGPVLIQKSK